MGHKRGGDKRGVVIEVGDKRGVVIRGEGIRGEWL